jgi:plastocyanin
MGATALFVAWPTSPSGAVESCAPAGQTADAKVILKDLQYQPSTVTFSSPGKTVCWEHQDGTRGHSITFDDATPAIDYPGPACFPGGPEADCFQQGEQAFVVIFETAGSFHYHCKIHGTGMSGVINVGGTSPTIPPGSTSSTTPRTTTTKATTNTTVGTLTTTTTDASTTTSTEAAVSSTTTSTLQLTTQTTAPGSALAPKAKSNDDDKPGGVLEAVGVILLAAAAIGLIPAWRRLT